MKIINGRAVLLKVVAAMIVFDLLLNLTLEIPTIASSDHHGHPTAAIIHTQEQQLAAPDWTIESITEKDTQRDPSRQRAVFYNVYLNPTSGITYLKSLKIVDEQLREIKNGTEVYYNLIGHAHRKNLCVNFPLLNCTLLNYQETGGEDLTLQRLYEYCHAYSGDNRFVTYLHDKGSFRFSSGNIRSRRRATRGALSDECLHMPLRQNYSCNLCGTKFQYMPHMNYQANMWTAQCSFIRQLVPPKDYIQKRTDLVERLYRENPCLSQMADPKMGADDGGWQWNLSNPMFLRNVGLGRYALERWMIQHPAMIPCEVWPLGISRMKGDTAEVSPMTLGIPTEWGKMVSKKVKARQTFYAKEEYAAFYPDAAINEIIEKDQSKPKARACWNLAEIDVPATV
jgi:hypothetical protein